MASPQSGFIIVTMPRDLVGHVCTEWQVLVKNIIELKCVPHARASRFKDAYYGVAISQSTMWIVLLGFHSLP
ncbi:unnamed protein product [Cuscuta campestris]|uniref:Uncharacterized protein n=1 Tax=Cuscuta campestris TaxID=132261 RepID=A0A484M4G7_9ASTE|nr:unnamed protein product [Cuscuta campestris]